MTFRNDKDEKLSFLLITFWDKIKLKNKKTTHFRLVFSLSSYDKYSHFFVKSSKNNHQIQLVKLLWEKILSIHLFA